MLVVGSDGMGDARTVLRDVGGAIQKAAIDRGKSAARTLTENLSSRVRGFLVGPDGGGPAGAPSGSSYLPWVIGAAAVAGAVVLLRRPHRSNPRRRSRR